MDAKEEMLRHENDAFQIVGGTLEVFGGNPQLETS